MLNGDLNTNSEQLPTQEQGPSKLSKINLQKKKARQQRYRERHREKLRELESERRKRLKILQRPFDLSIFYYNKTKEKEKNDTRISSAAAQSPLNLEKPQPSTIQSNSILLDHKDKNTEMSSKNTLEPENMDTPDPLEAPHNFPVKTEPEFSVDYLIEEQDDIHSTSEWKIKTENHEQSGYHNDDEDDDEKYVLMSLDELQRIALISQIKMNKAQEAAARSKEKLNAYKLMILKRNEENNSNNIS